MGVSSSCGRMLLLDNDPRLLEFVSLLFALVQRHAECALLDSLKRGDRRWAVNKSDTSHARNHFHDPCFRQRRRTAG